MENRSEPPVPKYLGRNVPQNFRDICERQHTLLMGDRMLGHLRSMGDYRQVYEEMFKVLDLEDNEVSLVAPVGPEIEAIEVRFRVIQKTIDMSVPTKPAHDAIQGLQTRLRRTIAELEDKDRNETVKLLRDDAGENLPRDTLEDFNGASSLAERITVAQAIVTRFSQEINEVAAFLDYKQGLATKGNPSRYAMLYAVHALAVVFERHNRGSFKANVGETVNTGDLFGSRRSNNARRYTGPFLAFVTAFIDQIDRVLIAGRNLEGFEDMVRKFAQGRRKDPDLFRLLHGATTVEDVLEFMRRADAVK